MSHVLAILNSNNFVVYGQKHIVRVLVFLVRTSGTLRPKLSRFGEIFCLQQNRIVLQQRHSRNAAMYFIKTVE